MFSDLLFGLFLLVSCSLQAEADPAVEEVRTALVRLSQGEDVSSLQMSEVAEASLHSISNINMFGEQRIKTMVWPGWSLDCTACEAMAVLIIGLFESGTPLEEIETAVISLCITLNIESAEVCEGMVHGFGYQFEYILNQAENLTPALFCGVFVGGDCGDQGQINNWEVAVPGDKPDMEEITGPAETTEVLRVLQIADVHVDLTYLAGSPVNCGLPCCCMGSTGLAEEGEQAAGEWGDYTCDIPLQTLEAMMTTVSWEVDMDYIIYTGDSPAHDVWLQSKDKNLENERTVLDLLASSFPGVPVYLALGNHESFPVNMFPTDSALASNVSGEWLYSGIADLDWADSLEPEARDLFRQNGFYSSLVRPGFRIISLNTNFCQGENFFLFLDFSDPADQLAWLAEELLKAESAGERVHILGHHPLKSCLPGWAREYGKIVNRFERTVTAQFHGHTHDDWFIVYHNEEGEPSNTAFVAPSGTSYTNRNPEFRVYSVVADQTESSFGYIMDHETWSVDLALANAGNVPEWSKLYSARSDLGLRGVGPSDWRDVLDRANVDAELYEKLVIYYNQNHWNGELPNKSSFLCRDVWNINCPY